MAGTSTLGGGGWTANPTPDSRYTKSVSVASVPGKPDDGVGTNGDLVIDPVGRKIYEKTSGAWSAGTSF